MQPDYWKKAQRELSRNCPTMKKLIAGYKGERGLSARGDGFYTLLRAIAGQQISVKAADAVWRKLEKSVVPLTPQSLLRKRDASLRKCGFSAQKVLYAKNVAKFFAGNHVDAGYWAARTDEEIIKELTSIKGIGTWTAEMFLIFHLLRPDVLPLKDLGLVKAIDRHYNSGKSMDKKQYLMLAERWRPYRTVATWYLWRALDPAPVSY